MGLAAQAERGRPSSAGRLAVLGELRRRGGKALVPYVMVGDPDLETSWAVARAMVAAGADALELGIPFSDPLADGPVIQAAGVRALRGGFRMAHALELVRRLRRETDCPLCLMSYVNPIWQRGYAAFAREAREAGADGLIVPDLPLEESPELGAACRRLGMDLVLFVAPTSTDARLAAVAAAASGFVYCVSVAGVTGPREDTLARVPATVARARRFTDLPLLVGFGIDGPEKARAAAEVADGVVVASWIVQALADLGPQATPAERAARAGAMVAALRAVLPQGERAGAG
jgi:tryptophan synthase alpha chain